MKNKKNPHMLDVSHNKKTFQNNNRTPVFDQAIRAPTEKHRTITCNTTMRSLPPLPSWPDNSSRSLPWTPSRINGFWLEEAFLKGLELKK
jgi:hypothetical protein